MDLRYHPSLLAAIIFIFFFLISTAIHIFQAARYRTYYFIPLITGGLCAYAQIKPHGVKLTARTVEVSGYIGRALASNNQYNLSIYIFQIVLLLVAPTLFAASIYMVFGRVITLIKGEKLAPIRSQWLTKIFVCGDILSFFVQCGGESKNFTFI